MSASVRTIHRLDRLPGGATESRALHGVVIEKGIPIPTTNRPGRPGRLMEVLMTLEVGESFLHINRVRQRNMPKDRKFTTRRLAVGKYRVWRTT